MLRVLGAVLLFGVVSVGCGSADETSRTTGDRDSRRPTRPAPGSAPAESVPAEPDAAPAQARLFDLKVRGGAVAGGPRSFSVSRGDTVTLSISSDVNDEVHVHGIDRTLDLQAGRTVKLTFETPEQGSFEIEMHDAGIALGTLRVQ